MSADHAPPRWALRIGALAVVLAAALLLAMGRIAPMNGAQAASGTNPSAPLPGHPLLQTDGTEAASADALGADRAAGLSHLSWPASTPSGSPEGRLLEVYRLIGEEHLDQALSKARSLTEAVPNFQLAQLAYADLLMARRGQLSSFGSGAPVRDSQRLDDLRLEAMQRLAALQNMPPPGAIPTQFLELPGNVHHAIAVDASRSRLYLFRNDASGLKLINDFYVSVGRLGVEKHMEGDQRTPLGVYFITSRLHAAQLKDFYGVGALPLNYPNEYDRRMGKTGRGIWLHGVPSDSYARSPQSTDGCVVLSNQDLTTILEQITPRTTPVVIAEHLDWASPSALNGERQQALDLLKDWQHARSSGDVQRMLSFYSPQFSSGNLDYTHWSALLEKQLAQPDKEPALLKDVSILHWQHRSEILVLTFAELQAGSRTGHIKRQYWGRENGAWKIFYEGVLG